MSLGFLKLMIIEPFSQWKLNKNQNWKLYGKLWLCSWVLLEKPLGESEFNRVYFLQFSELRCGRYLFTFEWILLLEILFWRLFLPRVKLKAHHHLIGWTKSQNMPVCLSKMVLAQQNGFGSKFFPTWCSQARVKSPEEEPNTCCCRLSIG
jgi:hypothetical protein